MEWNHRMKSQTQIQNRFSIQFAIIVASKVLTNIFHSIKFLLQLFVASTDLRLHRFEINFVVGQLIPYEILINCAFKLYEIITNFILFHLKMNNNLFRNSKTFFYFLFFNIQGTLEGAHSIPQHTTAYHSIPQALLLIESLDKKMFSTI